jgi:type IV secretion system protein VirB8
MFGNKAGTPRIEAAVNEAVNYEISLADVLRRSERRAWFVAFSAILLALLLAGGYYLVLPLKERTPFLVMADPYRGTATVARLRGDFGKNSIVANEAVNKSNLAHYVIARESYDMAQRDIRDWTVIFTMSSAQVANAYRYLYARNNPGNLPSVYGRTRAIRIEIISITLLDSTPDAKGAGTGGGDAAVRFQRILVDKASGGTSVLDTRVANIRYNYSKDLALTEAQRIENPLGFQVTSYRVDTEMTSSPVMPDGTLPNPTGAAAQAVQPAPAGTPPVAAPSATPAGADATQAAPGQLPAPSQLPTATPADPRAAPVPATPAQPNPNGVTNP